MAEIRILVAKLGGRNCPVETNDNICLLGCSCGSCNGGLSRQDAIERMAKAICLERPCTSIDGCGLCELWRNFSTHAEAALNALLEGK